MPAAFASAQTLPSSGSWGDITISANETVNLTGDIQLDGCITIQDGATLTINNTSGKEIRIENASATARASGYMFDVKEGATLVISGNESSPIVIDGGAGYTWNSTDYRLDGRNENKYLDAVIWTCGTLTLRYVTACDAYINRGFLCVGRDFGGNTSEMGITTIENCIFERNKFDKNGNYAGGAILVWANNLSGKTAEELAVRITGTTFRHCVGVGGAIRSYGGTVPNVYLTDCKFYENYSPAGGGAVYWNGHGTSETKMVIDGCTFQGNKTNTSGGALFLEGTYEFVNNQSEIFNNKAAYYGGGICVHGYANNTGYNDKVALRFYVNEFMYVHDNEAKQGGGIAFLFSSKMSLYNESSFTCDLSGGTVKNNKATDVGGGIYFENSTNPERNYSFTINLESGEIKDNTATSHGGGIYAERFDIESNDLTNALRIQKNTAGGNGGGIYLRDGSMELHAVTIYQNSATGAQSDGGGVYIENGDFEIWSGGIMNNTSTYRGGGLFIANNEKTQHNLALRSGKISGNNAQGLAGGGIYAYGYLDIQITDIDIEDNKSMNGGGIMIKGTGSDKLAQLSYSSGLIRNNKAIGNGTSLQTAYQKSVEELNGIGGGIIVGAYGRMKFNVTNNDIGIYNNLADNGADDIFSSSEVSEIIVPNVSKMSLSDYTEAREHNLYWVEDYVTDDKSYDKGTCMKGDVWNLDQTNQRYRALRDGTVSGTIYQVSAGTYQKYLCLTLGWSSNYITLVKEGMSQRDNAIFKIYKVDSDNNKTEYMTVILTDNDTGEDGKRRKTIKLENGTWTVAETPWSWAYINTTNPDEITRTLTLTSSIPDRTFTFTNQAREDTPKHAESVKVNELNP